MFLSRLSHFAVPWICLALIAASPTRAGAATFNCGTPPPLRDEQLRANLTVKAQAIGKIAGGEIGGTVQTARSEIISRYPNADRVLADSFFNYEVCSIVMNDSSLTSSQKLEKIVSARKAFLQPVPGRSQSTSKSRPDVAIPKPEAAVVPPVTSTGQSGGNLNVIGSIGTFNQGTIPLSRRQYLPKLQALYAEGQTIHANAMPDTLTDAQIDVLWNKLLAWMQNGTMWIGLNMTEAASTKFTNIHKVFGASYALQGTHDKDHQVKYGTLNIIVPQMLDNIQYLMSTDAMDPQH